MSGRPLPMTPLAALAGLSLAAGALATRGRLRGLSPGASDNTSGVVAALVAAEAGLGNDTGLLFTGAEEFGLVGARRAAGWLAEIERADAAGHFSFTFNYYGAAGTKPRA